MSTPRQERAVTPTQTSYPWRAVVRTVVQVGLSALIIVPIIISIVSDGMAAYLPDEWEAWLAGAAAFLTALSGVFARVMAIPAINDALAKVGLSAAPRTVGAPLDLDPYVVKHTDTPTPSGALSAEYDPLHD